MKLVTFIPPAGDGPRVGAVVDDWETIADLPAAARLAGDDRPELSDMLALLDAGVETARPAVEFAASRRPAEILHPYADCRLLPPVPRPRSVRDCMAFEKHVLQATAAIIRSRSRVLGAINDLVAKLRGRPMIGPPKAWYRQPLYYKSNPHSVVGHGATIRPPSYTRRLDYELEFGLFIGRRGRDIAAERAMDHVAGFAIFNDFSARDVQGDEMAGRLGPAKAKDFDTGNAVGPALVTVDEVGDPHALAMAARINGEQWSAGTSGDMHFTWGEIIEHISRDETLHPGEFIASGTVGGGCGLELGRFLSPGDVVELEVEKLGILRNVVGEWPVV